MIRKSTQVCRNLPYLIFAAPTCHGEAVEVEAADQRADHRHDDVLDQRGDDLAEGGADDHADREVDDVALDREFAEFLDDAQARSVDGS